MPDWITALDWKDAIGVLGSFLIAGAYFGVSTGRLSGEHPPFQWVNLAGAVCILFSLWFRPNAGAILIEVLWVAIALWTLAKFYRGRKAP
ncbi:MAG: hypothetical protein AAF631_03310 [Pseudomonadota bacterium]